MELRTDRIAPFSFKNLTYLTVRKQTPHPNTDSQVFLTKDIRFAANLVGKLNTLQTTPT
jgi:hypothetical protein